MWYAHAQVYPNMRAAFVDIFRTRGIRGLYSGLTPTLVEIIPYAGLQFGTYDTFKRWMMVDLLPSSEKSFMDSLTTIFDTVHNCLGIQD